MSIAEIRNGIGILPPVQARPMSGPESGKGIDEIKVENLGATAINATAMYATPPSDFGYFQIEKGPAGQIDALSDHTEPLNLTPETINVYAALDILTSIPRTNQGRSAMAPSTPPPGNLRETGNNTPVLEPKRLSINVILALAAQTRPPKSNMGMSTLLDPHELIAMQNAV